MQLPLNLIPYFVVVDVSYDPQDFVYRFWGTASTTMHNFDMTGLSISAIRSPGPAKETYDQYLEVTQYKQAIGSAYTVQAGANGPPHIQTSLRMPMSDTGERVDQIVTFVDWRRNLKVIHDEFVKEYGE